MKNLVEQIKNNKKNVFGGLILAVILAAYLWYFVTEHMGMKADDILLWQKYSLVLGIPAIGAVLFLFVLHHRKKTSIEVMAAVICLLFGSIYSFVIPPNGVPDEDLHYYTVYRYSNFFMGQGFGLDSDTVLIRYEDTKASLYERNYTKEDYERVLNTIGDMKETGSKVEVQAEHFGNVTLYLPQTFAFVIGRVLNLGFTQMYYLGRLFNLLLFSGAVFVGIRKIPVGKGMLALVATLPMTLQQAASLSYDSTILACAFFLTGVFMDLILGDAEIEWKEMILICLSGAVLGSAKYGVYFPLLILWFCIPKEKFPARWNKKKLTLILFLLIAFVFLAINTPNYLLVLSRDNSPETLSTTEVSRYLVSDLFQKPLVFWGMVINTLFYNLNSLFLTGLGHQMGWLNREIQVIYLTMFFLLILISSLKVMGGKKMIETKLRRVLLVIFLLTAGALFCAAFTWTELDFPYILGLQGRYFLPVIPLIFLLIQESGIERKCDSDKKLIFISGMVHFFVIMQLLFWSLQGKLYP